MTVAQDTLAATVAPASEISRLFSLDVLRGLAILLVLIRHFPPSAIEIGGVLEDITQFTMAIGYIGVDLFFVLSGFLISSLVYREYERTGGFNARRFWLRRAFKIWPAYFAAYGGMTLLRLGWEAYQGDYAAVSHLSWNAGCNALFLQNYLPCDRWSHSWSLAVEEHFYTAFALIAGAACWWAAKRSLAAERAFRFVIPLFATIAVLALVLRWREVFPEYLHQGGAAYYRSHMRADSLLFGVFLGYVLRYRKDWLSPRLLRWPAVTLALASAAFWPALLPKGETPYSEFLSFTLLYLSFGVVVAAASVNPRFGHDAHGLAKPALRGLAWMGVYSYTIYLMHSILFGIPGVETLRLASLELLLGLFNETAAIWIDRLMYLGLSVVGGVVLSHAVERPALRLRQRVYPQ